MAFVEVPMRRSLRLCCSLLGLLLMVGAASALASGPAPALPPNINALFYAQSLGRLEQLATAVAGLCAAGDPATIAAELGGRGFDCATRSGTITKETGHSAAGVAVVNLVFKSGRAVSFERRTPLAGGQPQELDFLLEPGGPGEPAWFEFRFAPYAIRLAVAADGRVRYLGGEFPGFPPHIWHPLRDEGLSATEVAAGLEAVFAQAASEGIPAVQLLTTLLRDEFRRYDYFVAALRAVRPPPPAGRD